MCDQWMPAIMLPLTWNQFHQLPRNSAYKYEYLEGKVYLNPRPRHYHALLDLQPIQASDEVIVRPLHPKEFEKLVPLFAGTFRSIQPFGSLDDETRKEAARQALERTRTGGDGPLIEQASFLAFPQNRNEAVDKPDPIGAILMTLLPEGDPRDWENYRWKEPPPPDCIEHRLGRPHLTWIFVGPLHAGRGVGTALLAAAVKALLDMGLKELVSTFMLGNDSSMLWHWRNGFRLLSYPGLITHH